MSTQLSLSEAAKILKVSEKSIRRYIKAGRMKATLIKGQKGYEYRIDKGQLKVFAKPPRGKNSHHRSSPKTAKLNTKKLNKVIKKETKPTFTPMSSVKEIAQKRIENLGEKESDNIDYKILYEKLLAKYEQSLMMIGSLEAQLNNAKQNNGFLNRNPGPISQDQEDTILELYQLLKQNQKHSQIE